MKKVFAILAILPLFCRTVQADTIIIVDDNNIVKQQIYTGSTPATPQPQQIVVTQPQEVIVTQPALPPQVVVVRETPIPRNYYYDSVATSAFAGFTGAVIGTALFHPRGHHHHHHGWHGWHGRHRR